MGQFRSHDSESSNKPPITYIYFITDVAGQLLSSPLFYVPTTVICKRNTFILKCTRLLCITYITNQQMRLICVGKVDGLAKPTTTHRYERRRVPKFVLILSMCAQYAHTLLQ